MDNTKTKCELHHVAPKPGLRLDRALADSLPELSRNRIKVLIKTNQVSSDEVTITDPSYRVKHGDHFIVTLPQVIESELSGEDIPLDIIFEDEHLLVLNKPSGLTVHPGAGQSSGTLVNALIAHCGKSLSGIGGIRRPGIVHRLDKDTTGLMVVAKTDTAHKKLAAQFEARTINRSYHAFVWGNLKPTSGEFVGNIGRHRYKRIKMAVVEDNRGKPALTRYDTVEKYGYTASLVNCRLATGRTHQIRVHFAHFGHALLGDPLYGKITNKRHSQLSLGMQTALKALGRQALHAKKIGFIHPTSETLMQFESNLPKDLEILYDYLNSHTADG